jgi:carbon-monoxide dehydrogenase iron sulfur subunit
MSRFIAVDREHCTGCQTCELLCSLYHFGECNPQKSAIDIIRRERDGLVFCLPLVCQHCEPAPCIEACPTGALSRDEEKGILTLDKDECTACELCVEACPIGCISLNSNQDSIIACDLCGGDPQCVPACHAHCLTVVDTNQRNDRQNAEYLARVLEQEDLLSYIPGRRA